MDIKASNSIYLKKKELQKVANGQKRIERSSIDREPGVQGQKFFQKSFMVIKALKDRLWSEEL